MKKDNLSYRILTSSDKEAVINFCLSNNMYEENNLIYNVTDPKWSNRYGNHIGYGCFDGTQLIGYIGSIQVKREELIYNNLSCGLVDEKYRGLGISTKLFNLSVTDGDIILDLTPSELVYQSLKRHFPQFIDISEYQLWFNTKRLKRQKDLCFYTQNEDIFNIVDEKEKKYITDNQTYFSKFVLFSYESECCLVSYYTMKKKHIIKGFEITYCSNFSFFEKYYESILKVISKLSSSIICFLDKRFLPNIELKGKILARGTDSKQYIKRLFKLLFNKYIKAPNRKIVIFGDNKIDNLDYLYTEMSFYDNIE